MILIESDLIDYTPFPIRLLNLVRVARLLHRGANGERRLDGNGHALLMIVTRNIMIVTRNIEAFAK